MRFSTCRTEISLPSGASTCSRRSVTESILEDLLLVGDLDRQMGGDGVGELGVVLDLMNDADDFRRNLLVELDVALELVDDRARQRLGFDLARRPGRRSPRLRPRNIRCGRHSFDDAGALGAFDQHLHGAIGQLEQLQHVRQRADIVDGIGRGIIVGGVFCVASRMKVSLRITSSSALIDFSRPTKSGTIMCGKTTMSRSGSTG